MSVAYTQDAVRARTKSVTRRKGWRFVKPGDRIVLCRKVMGRKAGEPLDRIAVVKVVDVRRERLRALTDNLEYGFAETTLEGFPEGSDAHDPSVFIDTYFVGTQRMSPADEVTRIEWRYLDDPGQETAP